MKKLMLVSVALLIAGVVSVRAADTKELWEKNCAKCHGPDGKGETATGKTTKARDICSAEVKKETDAAWTDIIVKGKNKMPSYDKKITDAEVKDVIAYMRSLCK